MTTKVDDATLVAFVDGELRPAAMARVQDALPVEPQLQQRWSSSGPWMRRSMRRSTPSWARRCRRWP